MNGANDVEASRTDKLVCESFKLISELEKVTSSGSVVSIYAPVSGLHMPVEKLTFTPILLFLFPTIYKFAKRIC